MEDLTPLLNVVNQGGQGAAILILLFIVKKQFDFDKALKAFGERLAKLEGYINAKDKA